MKKLKRIISLLGVIILLRLCVKKIPQESSRDLQKAVVSKTVGKGSEHIGIDPKVKALDFDKLGKGSGDIGIDPKVKALDFDKLGKGSGDIGIDPKVKALDFDKLDKGSEHIGIDLKAEQRNLNLGKIENVE